MFEVAWSCGQNGRPYRLPKQMMFGRLSQPPPAHDVDMMCRRDRVKKDMKKFGIAEEGRIKCA